MVDLLDEGPRLIEKWIKYCYTGRYATSIDNHFLEHVKMFAASLEYGIRKLEYAAVAAYSKTDRTSWAFATFLESVPFIYSSTPKRFKYLRNQAVSRAVSHLRQLTGSNKDYIIGRAPASNRPFLHSMLYTSVSSALLSDI
jgi:hypothetical protein